MLASITPSRIACDANTQRSHRGHEVGVKKAALSASVYLGNDELGVLGTVELQLLSDVGEGDPRVREADHTHTCTHTQISNTLSAADEQRAV